MTLKIAPGNNIDSACEAAIALAIKSGESVDFDFNGTKVIATADSTTDALVRKFHEDMQAASVAYRASPEYIAAEKARAEEWERKTATILKESAQTEKDMREAASPHPYTPVQLNDYIASLVEREHDYGTCCYAMSLAATAAFNYVAHKLDVTGFQASCADLDFLRRSRHLEGPFMIVKGEDALYPQYDLHGKLSEAINNWQDWIKEQATKKLSESLTAHPDVIAHWKRLAR